VLGAGTSAPAFGQASSFTSPFAGGLGKALGGTGTGTFGSKSSFGSFGRNTTSAFAQAAGMRQQSGFMGGTGSQNVPATAVSSTGGVASGNRFTVLGEGDATKEEEMADEATPAEEKPTVFGAASTSSTTNQPPVPPREPITPPPVPPSREPITQPTTSSQPAAPTLDLSSTFGGLSTTAEKPVQPAPVKSESSRQSVRQPSASIAAPVRPVAIRANPPIDVMAAWMAPEFTIGRIPETEPPVNVRG